jgi:2-oxoglutarate ferredoxin oxidoreductase subunit beta
MNTFGFHTIHGRAPAVATGLKVANPDLTVWVITGDGDALSIGGNHLLHILRRNVDVNILLFNNKIYGLTKGQYSPTSELGKKTKSSPFGSVDHPLNPLQLALGAGATFVARALDVDAQGTMEVLREAVAHRGTSFVEIFQNCNVFNDGAHEYMSAREVRKERQVWLQQGQELLFGEKEDKAIVLDGFTPKVVTRSAAPASPLRYDQHNRALASLIADLHYPEFPVPMGVLYSEQRPSYEKLVTDQVAASRAKKAGDLEQLIMGKDSWVVE